MANNAIETRPSGTARPAINENQVKLTGTAIHKYKVPGVDTVVLTVATSGSSSRSNYPKVVWYGDRAKEVEESINLGDRISLVGTLQTSKYEREGEKTIYRQTVVGREIKLAESKMEKAFGLRSERSQYVDDVNDVHLAGSVLHIYQVPDRDITVLTVRTFTRGRVNTPKVTLFGRTSDYVQKNIEVGMPICVIGYLYTNKSEDEAGNARYHEGVTCTSISVAPNEIETAYKLE